MGTKKTMYSIISEFTQTKSKLTPKLSCPHTKTPQNQNSLTKNTKLSKIIKHPDDEVRHRLKKRSLNHLYSDDIGIKSSNKL